ITNSVGPIITGIAVADITGDSIPDVVLGSNSSTVFFERGNGDGTVSTYFTSSPTGTLVPRIADVNADGKPDVLVTATASNVVFVYLGVGNGSFSGPSSFNTGGSTHRSLALRDAHGDRRPDVVVCHYSSNSVADP